MFKSILFPKIFNLTKEDSDNPSIANIVVVFPAPLRPSKSYMSPCLFVDLYHSKYYCHRFELSDFLLLLTEQTPYDLIFIFA